MIMLWLCFTSSVVMGNDTDIIRLFLPNPPPLPNPDSLLISASRKTSLWEAAVHKIIEISGKNIKFHETAIAKHAAASEFASICHLLDYSSVSHSTLLYRTWFEQNLALSTMFRFMAKKTKKMSFCWQQELEFVASHIFAPSPKQYDIELLPQDITLPLQPLKEPVYCAASEDPLNYLPCNLGLGIKKAKGTRASILKFNCLLLDFVLASKTEKRSRGFVDYGMRKKNFRIYITCQTKLLLTKCSLKRLSFLQLQQLHNHFTFPLFVKQLLKSDTAD